jgi:hypothetical protein
MADYAWLSLSYGLDRNEADSTSIWLLPDWMVTVQAGLLDWSRPGSCLAGKLARLKGFADGNGKKSPSSTDVHVGARVRMRRMMFEHEPGEIGAARSA